MTIGEIASLASTLTLVFGLLFTGFWAVFRRFIDAKFELFDFKFGGVDKRLNDLDKRLDETNRVVTDILEVVIEIKENQVKELVAQ